MPKWTELTVAVLLATLTAVTFWPVTNCQFINYDDNDYVTANPHVRQGVTAQNVGWAFTTGEAANWHPLTWFSLMLDYQVFGDDPRGYHAVNLALHVANVVLVFLVLNRMTQATARSALVAALFAVHPLRVESVAWVSERKDVLCALFGLAAIGAYLGWVRSPSRLRYALLAALFALCLLAKPMLVTLPCLLLLLDFWPLGRLRFGGAPALESATGAGYLPAQKPLGLVYEKLPLFALAAACAAVTFLVLWKDKAVKNLEAFPLDVRLENALVSYVRYLGMMFRFDGLAVFYPHPGAWPAWQVIASGTFLFLSVALVLWRLRGQPWLAVGWFWYLGLLVPVIGLVQLGMQALADRYTYLPSIGLALLLIWSLPKALFRRAAGRVVLGLAAAGILAALALCSRTQIAYWQDSRAVFEHALAVTENNNVAHLNLANYLLDQGQTDTAFEQFRLALEAKPDDALIYYNRANTYRSLGNMDLALADYDAAIQLIHKETRLGDQQPALAVFHYGRGAAYRELRRDDDALADYDRAIALNPDFDEAYNARGTLQLQVGDRYRAVQDFAQVVRLKSDSATAYFNRGFAQAIAGMSDGAIADFSKAIQLKPSYTAAYVNRGNVLRQLARPEDAIRDFDKAIELEPDNAEAYANRGDTYQSLDKLDQAIQDLSRAIELKPDYVNAYYSRAKSYYLSKRYAEAWADVRTCRKLGGQVDPSFRQVLSRDSGHSE